MLLFLKKQYIQVLKATAKHTILSIINNY